MTREGWAASLALMVGALGAPNDLVVAAEEAPAVASQPAEADPAAEADRRPFRPLHFEFGVRGFSLASFASSDGIRQEDLELTLLRPEIRWEPSGNLRAVLEADVSGDPRITDAFVRWQSSRAGIRVGQFKPPFSALEMASRWEIPAVDRGLLHTVLVDAMGWAGRRPGVEARLRRNGAVDVDFRAGAFRASHMRGDRIGDEGFDNLRDGFGADSQSFFGRLEISRRRGSLGVSGEWRPAEPVPGEGSSRYWATGVDFTWIPRRRDGGLQTWLEGFVGSSWQDSNAFDGVDATFAAGRALLAWRFKGERRGRFFVEPYARASILDPDTSVAADAVSEATGGVGAGLRDRLRVNVEVRHERFSKNVPLSLGLEPLAAPSPGTRTSLLVQLGGAF